jgi:hypothetical protein
MSVVRVQELSNLDTERTQDSKARRMPKEPSKAGDALIPLLPKASMFNTTLAPLDTSALLLSGWPWRGNIRTYPSPRQRSAGRH